MSSVFFGPFWGKEGLAVRDSRMGLAYSKEPFEFGVMEKAETAQLMFSGLFVEAEVEAVTAIPMAERSPMAERGEEPRGAPAREAAPMAPMLAHYLAVKRRYPDHLLLFQVGDFYEVFFDDARIVADALQIRLTSRNKDQADPIPLCGVPIHALENYLPRLLRQGFSCVIVSQTEDARNKKGMVQRDITRIVTPGVRYEGDGLEDRSFNYLAAVCLSSVGNGAIGYTDVSTGRLRVQEVESFDELIEALRRVRPVELLVPASIDGIFVDRAESGIREVKALVAEWSCRVSARPFVRPTREQLRERLATFTSAGRTAARSGTQSGALPMEVEHTISQLSRESAGVVAGLLEYVEEVSFGAPPILSDVMLDEPTKSVFIDSATRRNLELTETRMDGERKYSLLGAIDTTKTAMGSRLLGEWILSPSADAAQLTQRYDAVEELVMEFERLRSFRQLLATVRDLDRLMSRVSGLRASPKDLAGLRDSLVGFPELKALLAQSDSSLLKSLNEQFDALDDIAERLTRALLADPPLRMNEGGIFAEGYHPEIDRLREIGRDGSSWLADLEQRERVATGISSLKVRFNNVFGYYIEVSKIHGAKVPSTYERRQTLANAERFIIPELKEYEQSLLSAKGRLQSLEHELFVELRGWVGEQAIRVQQSARTLSTLDVLCSFAETATNHRYTRPVICAASETRIVGGRHPVVEQVIGAHSFVPNDTLLDTADRRFAVLTGPNMGGKSTYLRQVGLIQLLAQAGSFVPAERAEIGLVDRIFTRIGAADDLARGDSTFMVEMREAATIVKRATAKSLVLIDEIGRGTATQDGLAIARAIAEWLHDVVSCRTIFATHFHELTDLPAQKPGAFCLAVGVVESGMDIEFTHRIEERAADRSYGIEVARLAGLPDMLLERARELLGRQRESERLPERLQEGRKEQVRSLREQVEVAPQEARPPAPQLQGARVVQRLLAMNPNSITPLQALVELVELKSLAHGSADGESLDGDRPLF